ncbi:MAG: glutathione S-transferase family protein [Labilithrix sp.]|nr:glutathione S-transferase family protein [Labilithrix sp.]
MKLYQSPLSPNCQKVVALAHEVGVSLTIVNLDVFKGQAKSPEMLAKNPNGRVPVLEDGAFVLWESNAMLGYVASKADRTDLAPTAPRERADVDRWLAWSNAHFAPAVRKVAFERVVKKLAGLGAPDEAVVKAGTEEFAVVAAVLDRSLEGKDHLCGRLTIADFANVTYGAVCDSAGLALTPYRNIQRWLGRMMDRESVQRALLAAREAR